MRALIRRVFSFPWVVIVYVVLYVVTVVPFFTSDPGNLERAAGWAFVAWVYLTLLSLVVAFITTVLVAHIRRQRKSNPVFNFSFAAAWILWVVFFLVR